MLSKLAGAWVLLSASVGPGFAQSYSIITIAGTDHLRDGGPALSSLLRRPSAVAVDAGGNVYISDSDDARIRRVDGSGIITTLAGMGGAFFAGDNGQATKAAISDVRAIAIDATGNVYLADQGNSRVRKIDASGIITTVAGNGHSSYSGDGVLATSTSMDPRSVAVDASGNLYIADETNYRIRKVSVSGIITTVAGTGTSGYGGDGGPATSAQIGFCTSVAVDPAGILYFTDVDHNRIRKVTSDGKISTIAGNGSFQYGGDGVAATLTGIAPLTIAFSSNGNLYVADQYNNRIRKIANATGLISTVAGNGTLGYGGDNGPATSAMLAYPASMIIAADQSIYVADQGNFRVRKIAPDGIITAFAGSGVKDGGPATDAYLNFPDGIATDAGGNLYIADAGDDRIRKVDASGNITTFAGRGIQGFTDGGQAAKVLLNQPSAVAIDSKGNVYIADAGNFRIRKVASSGVISTFAGTGDEGFSGDGGQATAATIGLVSSLAFDTADNLYVADLSSHHIRKITPAGVISTIAGNGQADYAGEGVPATSAQLFPWGLTVDHTGNIYVADGLNDRVRKIDAAGIITTVAGSGGTGFAGDGGPAKAAQLFGPSGVAVDGSGNLYIADALNFRVRRVDKSGTITTIAGNGSATYSGDGGPALLAQLGPFLLATDNTGGILVTDVFNDRIRKLTLLVAARLVITAGDKQTGDVGTQLGSPLVVTVTDSTGLPVSGVTVKFAVASGTATVSSPSAVSGADGTASTQLILGSTAGVVTVTASSGTLDPVSFGATITATGGVALPIISAGGVVGAGLSAPAVTAASTNGILSAFGTNFAPIGTFKQVGAGDLVNGQLPTIFEGVCVLVGSVRAPIFAVLSNQINFQATQVPASGTVPVQVVRNCGSANELHSDPQPVTAQAASPEFFYFQQTASGKNPIAAINATTGKYVGAAGLLPGVTFAPASPGDILTLYFTGGGTTNPAFAAGELPDKAAGVTGTTQVTVGGVAVSSADVLYAGVAPHYAGLYQLNLRLSKDTPDGDQPVALTIAGIASPANGFVKVQHSSGTTGYRPATAQIRVEDHSPRRSERPVWFSPQEFSRQMKWKQNRGSGSTEQ